MMTIDLNNLTTKEALEVNTLYRKYVSTRRRVPLGTAILEAYGSIRHEANNAEKGIIKVTRGLLRELRQDRARIGYLAHKAIGREQLKQPFSPYGDYVEWMLNVDFRERQNTQ